jgi:hypothetical protein
MLYLPGIAFLFVASAVISIPFVMFVKNRVLAIILAAGTSTLILKLWVYFSMDGFDMMFLLYLILIGLCTALVVRFVIDRIRKRLGRGTQSNQ